MNRKIYRGDLKCKEDLLNYGTDLTIKKDLWTPYCGVIK